jgi:hypothetical protein
MTTIPMMTPTEPASGGALLATLVLLALVGIPTAYAVGLWWLVFKPRRGEDDKKE